MYHWDDGTVGYFIRCEYLAAHVTCAFMDYAGQVRLKKCDSQIHNAHYLCEKDESSTKPNTSQERPGIQLPVPSNSTVYLAHTVCPSGHWTHELLACDVQSACWQQDSFRQRSGSKTCQYPFSEMFTCMSGVGRVPYSLVCDHGQDCLDNSDEDFCVHPSCTGAWQFECTNQQVNLFSFFLFFLLLFLNV